MGVLTELAHPKTYGANIVQPSQHFINTTMSERLREKVIIPTMLPGRKWVQNKGVALPYANSLCITTTILQLI